MVKSEFSYKGKVICNNFFQLNCPATLLHCKFSSIVSYDHLCV